MVRSIFSNRDTDVDIQTIPTEISKLVALNQTVYERRYLLDVNPNSKYRHEQVGNIIDARFIDTENGYFMDITVVGDRSGKPYAEYSCKTPHYYSYDELFPLIQTNFAGCLVWRPHLALVVLEREYGAKALFGTRFEDYAFDFRRSIWTYSPEIKQHNQLPVSASKPEFKPKTRKVKIADLYFDSYKDEDLNTTKIYFEDNPKTNDTKSLKNIFMIWQKFSREEDIISWIAHDTLLGWKYSRKLLPAAEYVSIQTIPSQISKLMDLNQALYLDRYLLDVSPNSRFKKGTEFELVDARVTDLESNACVQITIVGKRDQEIDSFSSKNQISYSFEQLFPLVETQFEGVSIYRPNRVEEVLRIEYGSDQDNE